MTPDNDQGENEASGSIEKRARVNPHPTRAFSRAKWLSLSRHYGSPIDHWSRRAKFAFDAAGFLVGLAVCRQ